MTDRRKLLAGARAWNPAMAGPTAWYYASGHYVSLNGANVVNWADRTLGGNDIIQSTALLQPLWEANGGWSASEPSIRSESERLVSPSGGLAPIETVFSGTNRPFTALITCQVLQFPGDSVLCMWSNTNGDVRQRCIVTSSQFIGITRTDSVTTRTATATISSIGTGHIRVAYTFDGVFAGAYLNTIRVINGDQLDVGATTFHNFTVGDARDVRMTEVVIYPRAFSAAEVALYYAYSLAEWGV